VILFDVILSETFLLNWRILRRRVKGRRICIYLNSVILPSPFVTKLFWSGKLFVILNGAFLFFIND